MMAKTITADLSWQPVGEIACLLQSMADQLWEAADAAGVDSPLHSLGLGSFLAAIQATNMLPADGDVPNHSANEFSDPLRMLRVVEQLTRQLDPHLEGALDLHLAVTDLVREVHPGAA